MYLSYFPHHGNKIANIHKLKKRFILAPVFRGFSPWLAGSRWEGTAQGRWRKGCCRQGSRKQRGGRSRGGTPSRSHHSDCLFQPGPPLDTTFSHSTSRFSHPSKALPLNMTGFGDLPWPLVVSEPHHITPCSFSFLCFVVCLFVCLQCVLLVSNKMKMT